MWGLIRQFFRCVIPQVLRPLRVLWNQIIGFVFLVLALWAVPSALRTWRQFQEGQSGSLGRVMLAGLFIALMLWFGISSFLRARKISRS